ncbi:hypothetical protein O1D97_01175 [Marinomonas sp. 15G1-11]|uniref:N-acetyltransferase domain-containing protein n=1 Tax=Marinomonas phaeophyticola TaxID=3004091 RepID=A0ABT4JR40_9GAMM|nr:hypothetical protein [Marinomonas sp. 15G1-11]MCZ2720288.1 hypothetical protein [Marinomonas sp. 15G1-11]
MQPKYSITKALSHHVPWVLELAKRENCFYEFYSYSKMGPLTEEDLLSRFENDLEEDHYLILENKQAVVGWIIFVFQNEQKSKAELLLKIRKDQVYSDVVSYAIRSLLPVLGCCGLESLTTRVDMNNQFYYRIFETSGLTPVKAKLPDSNLNKFIVHLIDFRWRLE